MQTTNFQVQKKRKSRNIYSNINTTSEEPQSIGVNMDDSTRPTLTTTNRCASISNLLNPWLIACRNPIESNCSPMDSKCSPLGNELQQCNGSELQYNIYGLELQSHENELQSFNHDFPNQLRKPKLDVACDRGVVYARPVIPNTAVPTK